jgi:hypothetical protein
VSIKSRLESCFDVSQSFVEGNFNPIAGETPLMPFDEYVAIQSTTKAKKKWVKRYSNTETAQGSGSFIENTRQSHPARISEQSSRPTAIQSVTSPSSSSSTQKQKHHIHAAHIFSQKAVAVESIPPPR